MAYLFEKSAVYEGADFIEKSAKVGGGADLLEKSAPSYRADFLIM